MEHERTPFDGEGTSANHCGRPCWSRLSANRPVTFPSDSGSVTTRDVGYFHHNAVALARWAHSGFGERWNLRFPNWRSFEDALPELAPINAPSRYAFVPIGEWTLVLNNARAGTDLGIMPVRAVHDLHCRAIRAAATPDTAPGPGRVLIVYGPDGEPPLMSRRSIVAAKDGARWIFETTGEPFDFEDQIRYSERHKKDRLTTSMVHLYLRRLDVPTEIPPDWRAAIVMESETLDRIS